MVGGLLEERAVPQGDGLENDVDADLEEDRQVRSGVMTCSLVTTRLSPDSPVSGTDELEGEVVAALEPDHEVVRDMVADEPLAEDPHDRQVAVLAAGEHALPVHREGDVAVVVDRRGEPEVLDDVEDAAPERMLVRRRREVGQCGGVAICSTVTSL